MVVVQLLRRPKAFALNKAQNMFPNKVSPWHPLKFMYSYVFHTIFSIPCQRSHWIHAKHWVILVAPCGRMLGFLHIFAIFEFPRFALSHPDWASTSPKSEWLKSLATWRMELPGRGPKLPPLRGRNLSMVNHWTQLEWSSKYAPNYTI